MSDLPFNGRTILVVDDDLESLNIATMFLEFYGATVVTATNGENGLQQIRTINPDIVFADLAMPVLSGWDMLAAVKSDSTISTIPIIALTASATMGTRDKALEAGFADYLTKPFSPVDFKSRMSFFLEIMER